VRRILKPRPRPFIALTVIFGLLLCLTPAIALTRGMLSDAAKIAACILIIYGVLCFFVSRGRIVVSTDSIVFRPALGTDKRVYFRSIIASLPKVLAEPEHPISLEIYCESRERPAIEIGLKSFRQSDVAWLLSLPELKVQR
jgi:hypothetical protein